ncbi:MAG: acyl-CoA dehydrogenase family protein [Acidimicrobiales bacterium]
MEFAFSEDQLAFRDAVRDLLAGTCPPEAVRAAWDADDPWDGDRWDALVEMGVVGLTVPEADGGLGMTEVDLVLLLEEAGRAALPEPLMESALLAPHVPGGGSAKVAAAPADATHVAGAASADLVVVGSTVYPAPTGVQPQPSVDRARRLVRSVDVTAAEPLATVGRNPFERMAFGTAATLVGVARRLVEVTVEYAKERQQFGQPIGGFQAVKHHLASAHVAVEFAAPAVYRAAWSLGTDQPTVARDVSMAKAMAGDAAEQAARVALQVHGAIGYTFESDLHLWMKRVWALSPAWGDAAWHRRRVAAALLDQ